VIAAAEALARYHEIRVSSTGKSPSHNMSHPFSKVTGWKADKPDSAPHSQAIFAIVNLSETDRLDIVCSDPANSTHIFSTSDPRKAQRAMITSLPVTPGGKTPVNVTFAIGGTCQKMVEVARTLAASERTIAVPRQPMPP
jgi:hypothetical protein